MRNNPTAAKIFPAGQRGCTETDWFRSYSSFPFGAYQPADRQPFGALYLLNDDTVAGGRTLRFRVDRPTLVLVLPSVGVLQYADSEGRESDIMPGQCAAFGLPAGGSYALSNPYPEQLINYLQWWMALPEAAAHESVESFSLRASRNRLAELQLPAVRVVLGLFDGRAETMHTLRGQGLFVFVVQGAFEVQHRLLEARDGLALWNTDSVELEALSNEAILLGIEV